MKLSYSQSIQRVPYLAVSLLIVIADRVSKVFFERFLSGIEGGSISAVGEEFARFTLAYNEGIAFSIDMGGRYVLSAVSLLASSVITCVILSSKKLKKVELWSLSMILGGAVGNLWDRITTGRVIDFIDCDFPDIIMERWPVFNIADSFITVGMVFLAVSLLFEGKQDKAVSDFT